MDRLSLCTPPDVRAAFEPSLRRHLPWLLAAALLTGACGSDSSSTAADAGAGGTCDKPGAATPGAKDDHCGKTVQETTQASCHPADAGTEGGPPDYGAPLYGTEADDDDCKYHVAWTATPLCDGEDVYFTVKVTSKTDKSPVKGAKPRVDLNLGETHPGIVNRATATEGPDGTYKIGPVQFNASGKWDVRFHFFEDCADSLENTPHAHVAFFITVP